MSAASGLKKNGWPLLKVKHLTQMFKRKHIPITILSVFLLTAVSVYMIKKPDMIISALKKSGRETPIKDFFDTLIGEKIIYEISLGKVPLGTAIFHRLPNTELNGRQVHAMVFETKLTTFKDTETIYSDAKTMLPVKVERDISQLLKKEKITEHYDTDNSKLTIIKHNGDKEQKTVLEKEDPIHNPILLPHYVRNLQNLEIGDTITANLPKQKFAIKLVKIEEINVPAGTFQAYHFQSDPEKIDIWLSQDKNKLPLKIKGIGPFAYSLQMKKYIPPEEENPARF